ncbi:MAG: hypothetical protein WB792_15780 [Desulfobacterales bacterium]
MKNSWKKPPISKMLALLCMLLIFWNPSDAAELHLLGGIIRDTSMSDFSYTYSVEYKQELGEYTAASLSYLNEGHLPDHHRDGIALQMWGHTKPMRRHFVLAAGLGPYYYYDTDLAGRGASFRDDHGLGAMFSIAGLWYTKSPWVIQLRTNFIKTNNIDTYSAMLGVGYRLDYQQKHVSSSGVQHAPEKTRNNEIAVLIGQTIVNSRSSPKSTAQSIEYRRRITSYLEWTVALLNEGDNRLIRRNGLISQAWLVRDFFDEHLSLGAGFGPYVLIDRYRSPDNNESEETLAGIVTLSASYRFTPTWLIRLSWNRIATTYNRDTDVFLIGPGFRF